jgi:hypothetical protein
VLTSLTPGADFAHTSSTGGSHGAGMEAVGWVLLPGVRKVMRIRQMPTRRHCFPARSSSSVALPCSLPSQSICSGRWQRCPALYVKADAPSVNSPRHFFNDLSNRALPLSARRRCRYLPTDGLCSRCQRLPLVYQASVLTISCWPVRAASLSRKRIRRGQWWQSDHQLQARRHPSDRPESPCFLSTIDASARSNSAEKASL